MMEFIVQWATILSPIIAVLIAWWMSKSSARATDKKIAALEDSTNKQVENIKKLAKLQVDIMVKRAELEAGKTLFLAKQAQQEANGINAILNSGWSHFAEAKEMSIKKFQEKKPERDYELCCKFIKELEKFQERIKELKKEID